MSGKLVAIKSYTTVQDADLDKNRLDAAGIKCMLQNDGISQANPLLSNAVGWVRLAVLEQDVEKAKELLDF